MINRLERYRDHDDVHVFLGMILKIYKMYFLFFVSSCRYCVQ